MGIVPASQFTQQLSALLAEQDSPAQHVILRLSVCSPDAEALSAEAEQALLAAISRIMLSEFNQDSAVTSHKPGEYSLLLSDYTAMRGLKTARVLRKHFERIHLGLDPDGTPISFVIGVALITPEDHDIATVVGRACHASERAKARGSGTIELYSH